MPPILMEGGDQQEADTRRTRMRYLKVLGIGILILIFLAIYIMVRIDSRFEVERQVVAFPMPLRVPPKSIHSGAACVNFFQFACSLTDNNVSSVEVRQVNILSMVEDLLNRPDSPTYLKKPVDFYLSCKEYNNSRENDMLAKLDVFRIIDSNNLLTSPETMDLTPLLAELWELRAIEPFFELKVAAFPLEKATVQLSPSTTLLRMIRAPRNYRPFIYKEFDYFKGKFNYTVERKHIDAALNFERKLSLWIDNATDGSIFYTSLSGMQELLPEVNFNKLLSLGSSQKIINKLDTNPQIQGRFSLQFLSILQEQIWKVPETTLKTIFKIMVLRNLNGYRPSLLNGAVNKEIERLGHCCHFQTMDLFPQAIARAWIETQFDKGVEDRMQVVVSNIRSVFKDQLVNSDWLDKETVEAGFLKLEKMKISVGDSDVYLRPQILTSYYEKLEWERYDFVSMFFQVKRFNSRQTFEHLDERVPTWRYMETKLFDINLFYINQLNEIYLPVVYTHMAGYDPSSSGYFYHGRFGATFAHETGHAFDYTSRHYIASGERIKWMSPQAEKIFKNKSECLIEQYDSFSIGGEEVVNGSLTLNENIADNLGVKMAHLAYKAYLERHIDLTPSDFSPEEMFFISYAQGKCGSLTNWHSSDTHSPPEARVNIPLQNYPGFSEVFNCPVGSKMNPVEKCNLF